MWVASKFGWFSIVRKDRRFHVRARVRSDLVQLCAAAKLRTAIHERPNADYRFRILCTTEQLSRIFNALFDSIDYANFKAEIAASPKQWDKTHAYHQIWATMAGLQY